MFQVRLPEDLHRVLTDLAKRENRSLNGQIVHLLQRATTEPGTLLELASESADLTQRLYSLAQTPEASDDRR